MRFFRNPMYGNLYVLRGGELYFFSREEGTWGACVDPSESEGNDFGYWEQWVNEHWSGMEIGPDEVLRLIADRVILGWIPEEPF